MTRPKSGAARRASGNAGRRPVADNPTLAAGLPPMPAGLTEFYHSAAWKRLRMAQLRRAPLCEACRAEGRTTIATVADHVVPRRLWKGPVSPDTLENLRSLCAPHHGAARREQGVRVRR